MILLPILVSCHVHTQYVVLYLCSWIANLQFVLSWPWQMRLKELSQNLIH